MFNRTSLKISLGILLASVICSPTLLPRALAGWKSAQPSGQSARRPPARDQAPTPQISEQQPSYTEVQEVAGQSPDGRFKKIVTRKVLNGSAGDTSPAISVNPQNLSDPPTILGVDEVHSALIQLQ